MVGAETRMPAVFYSSDGVPKVDDPDADITAITAYLFEMGTMPILPADGARPEPPTPIDWTTHPY